MFNPKLPKSGNPKCVPLVSDCRERARGPEAPMGHSFPGLAGKPCTFGRLLFVEADWE